jgi:hypothetical protein
LKMNRKNHLRHQKRNKDEKEQLRGKNRELIKEVKRLKRLKARTPEQSDEWTSHSDDLKDEDPKGLKIQCPKCGGFETNVLEAAHKSYLICQNADCDYRGPLK